MIPPAASFSPAHPLARAFQFFMPFLEGAAEAVLYCAHRTSTFLSCAFCEQEGHLAVPFPSLLRPRVVRAQKIISLHPLRHGVSVSTGDQPGHPSPPATASLSWPQSPAAQPTAPIYFPSDGPDPSESLSHPPRPALLPASPHCRTQPQPLPFPPASPDYNRLVPPSLATRQRIANRIWISSSPSPYPTIQHSPLIIQHFPCSPDTIVPARYQAGKIMLKQLLCSPDLSPL